MSENKKSCCCCCGSSAPKKKVLLVDDDKDFVESNKDLLEAEGFEIYVAHTGADGLELAKKVRPNLMVLDVMMATKTEGFEVSRKIPQTPELKNMPILLVTGIRREMNLPFGFEPDETWLPVSSVMEKPIDPVKFVETVKNKIK
ncbi:MAG: response regulator [Candidatus Brocadiae bacterium]|nr:response regulator [Candidatus Brocadiia bacterium]